jgi:hypothetical protein
MRLRYPHRDHRDQQDQDDRQEHQRLELRIPGRHLGEDFRNQHPLDVERHLDVERRRLGVERRPDLGERQQRLPDEVRHLGEGRDPCPGWS